MFQTLNFTIKGSCPLMLHNGHLADPLNPFARELKRLTGNRKKTDDIHEAMARVEWYGSLYAQGAILVGNGTVTAEKGTQLVIPAANIESALVEAAKKVKKGPLAKVGLLIDQDVPLVHDGPKDINELFACGRYTDRRGVVVGTARVMRTRPIFRQWSLSIDVQYHRDHLDKKEVEELVEICGKQVGLCEWTPKLGRFDLAA